MTYEEFQNRFRFDPKTDKLGEGGYGDVFKAYDNVRDRDVAIKVSKVNSDYPEYRLKREVDLASELPEHPNIAFYEKCHTFDVGFSEYDFGILQYYETGNLVDLIKSRQLTNKQKSDLVDQILEGIVFLHEHNIVHRDLKPQNILIAKRGEQYIPKITDFGISKEVNPDTYSFFSNTLTGGTMAYASPEQLKGAKQLRKNTDLWSFGIVLYQLLTGELPFNTGEHSSHSEDGRIELARQIKSGNLPQKIEEISDPYRQMIRYCLVVDASKRVKSAYELQEIVQGKTEVNPPIPPVQPKSKTEPIILVVPKEKPHDEPVVKEEEQDETPGKKSSEKPKQNYRWVYILAILIVILCFLISRVVNNKGTDIKEEIGEGISNVKADVKAEPIVRKYGIFIDSRDGQRYNWVKIGNQVWMAENLKYNTQESWCFDNNSTNCNKYGRLYTYGAAKRACPPGWHIPSYKEWKILFNYLGGQWVASKKMKSTTGWHENGNGTNESGFLALPGGYRKTNGNFFSTEEAAEFWSSTDDNSNNPTGWFLYYSNDIVRGMESSKDEKEKGRSVRCLKDN